MCSRFETVALNDQWYTEGTYKLVEEDVRYRPTVVHAYRGRRSMYDSLFFLGMYSCGFCEMWCLCLMRVGDNCVGGNEDVKMDEWSRQAGQN